MSNDTKIRILETALKMFSEKGYEGTNIRELSAALGLSKAAFYKHYKSKEEIWNNIIDKMETYYNEHFGSPEHMPEIPKSCDELLQLTMNMVNFTVHDEKIILTRKILLTEQFHNERVKKLATEHFMNGTKEMFERLFEEMMKNGVIKRINADFLSLSYTAPITALIHYCDREPEKEHEIMHEIEAYIKHFIEAYGE